MIQIKILFYVNEIKQNTSFEKQKIKKQKKYKNI